MRYVSDGVYQERLFPGKNVW